MTAQLISFLLFLLLFGTSSCLGTGGTGPSPTGNDASGLPSPIGADGAPINGPDDRLPGDSPEEVAIPATPERPGSTVSILECYEIVNQLGHWQDQPASPEKVAECEGMSSFRCLGYFYDRLEGRSVTPDGECEVLYQAEAGRMIEDAATAVQRQRSSLSEHLIESRPREQNPPPSRREIEVIRKSLTSSEQNHTDESSRRR